MKSVRTTLEVRDSRVDSASIAITSCYQVGCNAQGLASVVARRRAEWSFKILGSFVGADEYVKNALRRKMESIRKVTHTTLLFQTLRLDITFQ